MHITGGKWNPESTNYLMTWKLKQGTEQLCTTEEAPGDQIIQPEKYPWITVDIKRHEVDSAENIL